MEDAIGAEDRGTSPVTELLLKLTRAKAKETSKAKSCIQSEEEKVSARRTTTAITGIIATGPKDVEKAKAIKENAGAAAKLDIKL